MAAIHKKIRNILLVFSVFIITIFVLFFSQKQAEDDFNLQGLSLNGCYSIDNGRYETLDYKHLPTNISSIQTLMITGHFSKDIPVGEHLFFKLNHLTCRLEINGKTVYETQAVPENTFLHSMGAEWISLSMPETISTKDTVAIALSTIYPTNSNDSLVDFFHFLCAGSERNLFQSLLANEGISLCIGIALSVIGIIFATISSILLLLKVENVKKIFLFSEFVFVNGIWFIIKCDAIIFIAPNALFLNILDIFCQYFITLGALRYAYVYCSGRRARCLGVCKNITVFFILLNIFVDLFTRYDFYDLISVGVILNCIFVACIAVCLFCEFQKQKSSEIRFLLITSIPLILGGFGEILNYLLGFCPVSLIFCISFAFFTLLEMNCFIYEMKCTADAAAKAEKLEKELMQSKVACMLSQIQPHFLYNTLAAIKQLCDENPKKASYAIDYFASFLRGNFDSLTSTVPIPFCKELKHVENYLALEKMRFEERLHIVYRISCIDFLLPPLTLQPLVEMVIRYDITKKAEGGTLTLTVNESDGQIILQIKDDVVGYELTKDIDERNKIAFLNIRSRLKEQCGGTLSISSGMNVGTMVEITLPKK